MDPAVVTLIGAFSKGIVDSWITPKLKEMYDKREIDKNFHDMILDKFGNYLNEVYKKQYIMNTIVFKNQQKTIEELYIPLHLNKISNDINDRYCIKIDTYDEVFISKYKKIIITDTAGMGKSTIMKWLFINSIKNSNGIPIFIELRKLSKENTVIKEILKNINPINDEFNKEYILNLLRRGDFIFFFDGYDEIPAKEKNEVTEDLHWFVSKASENTFIMSSREERALASFGDFQRFNIKPLEREEAYDLLRKYDKQGEVSEELISKIKEDKNLKLIDEFLTNPLMTSLLYKAYVYKKVIPYKKPLFYRQVYDALFEAHDYSKGGNVHDKESNLDMDDFEEILKYISYKSFLKGKNTYQREELTNLLKEAKEKNAQIQFKESAFINDLIKNVPLFIKDGIEYRWTHKSFQEYFAAKYICHNLKDKQASVLLRMARSYKNDEYFNVLDFCHDIDYSSFRKTIILDLVSNYIDYYNDTLGFDNIKVDSEEVNKRRAIAFANKVFISAHASKGKMSKIDGLTQESMDIIRSEGNGFDLIVSGKKYILGFSKLPCSNIIKLLRNKKEDFIIPIACTNEEDLGIDLDDTSIINELHEGHLIFLDGSLDNLLNRDNNFIEMNRVLEFELFEDDFHEMSSLDIEKCIKLKRDIERELLMEAEEDDQF